MSLIYLHPKRFLPRRKFIFFGMFAPMAAGTAAPGRETEHRHAHPVQPAAQPQTVNHPSRQIFDAHLHCPDEDGNVWQWHPVTPTFEEFDAYLTKTGVQRGIINSVRSQQAKTAKAFVQGNREVAQRVEKSRGRYLGACVVNPLFIDEALREMEDCRKQLGMIWVGELCNYTVPYEYSIREFEQLVNQAVKLNMILDVHTELDEMNYIIEKFPQATIVFPHFGDGREFNDIFKRIDAVAKHPNTYLDTSGSGHDRVGMLEYALKTIGPDRVLFGSDFSINDPSTVIARVENALISEEQRQKILSGNLEALLRKFGSGGRESAG
jgi:uncharacterized protein